FKDKLACVIGEIRYYETYLKLVDGSIGSDIFSSAMYAVSDGTIRYSALDAINGFDASKQQLFITATFEVTKNAKGSTEIKNTFEELFTVTDLSRDLTEKEYTDSDAVYVDNNGEESSAIYQAVDARDNEAVSSIQQEIEENIINNANSAAVSNSGASTTSQTVSGSNTSNAGNVESFPSTDTVSTVQTESKVDDRTTSLGENSIFSQLGSVTVSDEKVSDSNIISSDSNSEDRAVGISNVIVVIVIVVFVIVCIGAAVFFFKNKN
ncbi:MAG: hypothetical protein K2M82_06070, partial [Lachnospiraceae bacterium]|nr:hypothetical protein [Lachnospiraceae bacterium]